MGHPKQPLDRDGRSFAQVSVRALRAVTEQVLVLGDGVLPPALESLERIDDHPGIGGPLAGLLAAQHWAPRATWFIAACDLPLVSAEALRWLDSQRDPQWWAVVPRHRQGSKVEPLLAVYEPQAGALVEELAQSSRWGLWRLTYHPQVHTPAIPSELESAWTNINTRQELELLEGLT